MRLDTAAIVRPESPGGTESIGVPERGRYALLAADARRISRIALPLVIAQVSVVGMGFTDTIMAGRLGAASLAAVSMGMTLWLPIYLAMIGVMSAISPSISQLIGARRPERVGGVFRQGLWLAALLAVLGIPATREIGAIMGWIGVDEAIVPTARAYLNAFSWGIPGLALLALMRFFSEGVATPRIYMWVQLIGLPLNVFANYVFMYGNLGMPALGAVGCGVATALVETIMALMLLANTMWRKDYKIYALFTRFEGLRKAELLEQLRVGVPQAMSYVLEGGLFSAVALLMGTLGTVAVAAHQIAINFASMTFMVPLGFSMATAACVGREVGAGDRPALRRVGFTGIGLGVFCMLLSALVMLLLPEYIIGMYTSDQAVSAIAMQLLFIAAVFQLSDGLQVSCAGALRGLKDTFQPMLLSVVAYWCVGLPLAWYLGISRALGPQGLWLGLVVGLSLAAAMLLYRFQRLSRIIPLYDSSR